jgi:hypothetical protein
MKRYAWKMKELQRATTVWLRVSTANHPCSFFIFFPQTTAILGLLAYYGFTNSSSNIEGYPVSVWGESTLSRSSRGAEKLELL